MNTCVRRDAHRFMCVEPSRCDVAPLQPLQYSTASAVAAHHGRAPCGRARPRAGPRQAPPPEPARAPPISTPYHGNPPTHSVFTRHGRLCYRRDKRGKRRRGCGARDGCGGCSRGSPDGRSLCAMLACVCSLYASIGCVCSLYAMLACVCLLYASIGCSHGTPAPTPAPAPRLLRYRL